MSRPAILCVDDEKAILDSLQLELEKFIDADYVIELTESGDEAIDFRLD